MNLEESNLVWNHKRDLKIERARSTSLIWYHKYLSLVKYIQSEISKFSRSNTIIFSLSKYSIDSALIEFFFKWIWSVTLDKPWNLTGCSDLVKLFHWLGKKWCDLWIDLTNENQSECKDHRWFQNGCSRYAHCQGNQNL